MRNGCTERSEWRTPVGSLSALLLCLSISAAACRTCWSAERYQPVSGEVHVKARDADFNEDATPASIQFTVVPPVWRQRWFLSLIAVLAGLIVFQSFWLIRRTRALAQSNIALKRAHEEIERRVEERTAELAQVNEELRALVPIRERAEKALRNSEERFRQLAKAAFEGIAIHDKGHILEINETFLKIFGYERQEMIGRNVLTLAAPESRDSVKEKIQSGFEDPYEAIGLRKDGSTFPGELIGKSIPYKGGMARVTAVRDITEHKRAHSERERLIAQLKAKNTELEQFTYTVSHDLKSPLISIQGFLGYLEKDARQGNAEALAEDIGQIAGAVTKMNRLLDELLELSRIGRVTNPPIEIPLADLVNEALELLPTRFVGQHITVDVQPGLPIIIGDRGRLLQVLQNLIENAAKFSANRPKPLIEIGCRSDDETSVIYVKDNGIGIKPEDHEKVFGLFDKLDATTSGTGVGLAVAKRIIDVHGGRIWVESDGPGTGTVACFTLGNIRENREGLAA